MTTTESLKLVAHNIRLLADSIELGLIGAEPIPDMDEQVPPEEKTEPPKPAVTKAELHELLKAKSEDGKRKEVKKILLKYGDGTFSKLPPETYDAVYKEAEVL